MITDIRLLSQQLYKPKYKNPTEVVKWMGAIQAQEYNMAKWALGVRTKDSNLLKIEKALAKGDILRLHILRPTWHFVAAEDVKWMLMLCSQRIGKAIDSWGKNFEITKDLYIRCHNLIGKVLQGQSLTKEEVNSRLAEEGVNLDTSRIGWFLIRAEVDGIVCSGVEKENKFTYALLDERVSMAKELYKEEALAELAIRYFQSHSPASLEDFIWWSGLSITEAKQAINLIRSLLIEEKFDSNVFFTHQSYKKPKSLEDTLHFLPSYDEYLISYKSRFMALHPDNYSKAFNNYGIFYPVIMYNGKIVGNWNKIKKKNRVNIQTSFFDSSIEIPSELIEQTEKRCMDFWNKNA